MLVLSLIGKAVIQLLYRTRIEKRALLAYQKDAWISQAINLFPAFLPVKRLEAAGVFGTKKKFLLFVTFKRVAQLWELWTQGATKGLEDMGHARRSSIPGRNLAYTTDPLRLLFLKVVYRLTHPSYWHKPNSTKEDGPNESYFNHLVGKGRLWYERITSSFRFKTNN